MIAVKAFRLDIVPELVARLAESLRRLASSGLSHPAIVAPLDAGLEGTTAFLAMEYVAAETLDVALRHLAPMPLDRALPLLSQAAEAIEAAWAAGFGHGALHPRDMFVTLDSNEVRLSGFGVVPALEALGIKPPVRRPYTAPERLEGGEWDQRADVYSLGSIAHELLTRRRPAGPGEQDGALTTGTTPEQRVLIRRVLSAALAERPSGRLATAGAFVDALGAIARGEALTTLPQPEDSAAEVDTDKRRDRRPKARETRPLFVDIDEPLDLVMAQATEASEPPAGSETHADGPFPSVAMPSTQVETGSELVEPAAAIPADEASDRAPSHMWPAASVDSPHVQTHEPPNAWHPGATFAGLPETHDKRFPWSAIAAVAVAGPLLGLVIGYQWGRHAAAVTPPITDTAASRPADTEVPVQPDAATTPDKPAAPPPAPALAKSSSPAPTRAPAAGKRPAARSSVRATTGSIFVDSRPRAARVTIDGRVVGVTPLRVPELSVGGHTVRLELAAHQPFTTRANVKPGEQTRVTAALEQKR